MHKLQHSTCVTLNLNVDFKSSHYVVKPHLTTPSLQLVMYVDIVEVSDTLALSYQEEETPTRHKDLWQIIVMLLILSSFSFSYFIITTKNMDI